MSLTLVQNHISITSIFGILYSGSGQDITIHFIKYEMTETGTTQTFPTPNFAGMEET